ncbi:MAG TPA: hypothetical protein PKI05_14465 [Thermogutta sp.]|nr:hypothetical protein [Thermogutta sp.]HPU04918.1 hypothetical protein [Thermogutta sp.]HQF12893.1 hypothetical protein [Thermogutta sp.]
MTRKHGYMLTPLAMLNTLLNRLSRSLACYICQARPFVSYRDENVWQVIEEIASRHRELSHRLSEEIIRLKGVPDAGSFPPTYTRFNDLAVDYIAPKIAQELEETLTIIQKAKSEYHGHGELDNLLNQLAEEVQAEIEALQRELHEAHPQECLK